MSGVDPNKLIWLIASGVVAIAFGLAGVADALRGGSEEALREESDRLVKLQIELEERTAVASHSANLASSDTQHRRLPKQAEVVRTLQELQRLGDAAGIVIDGVRAMRDSTPGRQPFVLTGHGSARELCTFVEAIEVHERLMIVETGRLLPSGDHRVAFELGVATYHEGGAR